MPKLTFDKAGERRIDYGVDYGVLYVGTSYSVWNGLTAVREESMAKNILTVFQDGEPYFNQMQPSFYAAEIEAVTMPSLFSRCLGIATPGRGLRIPGQKAEVFNFAYRTMAVNGPTSTPSYVLHLVYNATASSDTFEFKTQTDTTQASSFKFRIVNVPEPMTGYRSVPKLSINSEEVPAGLPTQLENILYGTTTTNPRMPTGQEVIDMFKNWV